MPRDGPKAISKGKSPVLQVKPGIAGMTVMIEMFRGFKEDIDSSFDIYFDEMVKRSEERAKRSRDL